MNIAKKSLVTIVLMLTALVACDKYTAPSPIDGAWRMVGIEDRSGLTLPIPDDAIPYWDFSNVVYSVGYQANGHLGVSRMGYGNIYFDREYMTLRANEAVPHYFPIPSERKLTEVRLKYKVWRGKLTLIAPSYTIRLERR